MLTAYNRGIIATSVVGVLLSTYALYVEMVAEASPGYRPLCDLGERISCSRVLTSEFSKGFGIVSKGSSFEVPNCIYGIIFYCIIIILATYDHRELVKVQLVLTCGSIATSIYLAYLLAFVLYDLCVVCVSTYIVNGLLTVLVSGKLKMMQKLSEKKK